MDEKKFLFFLDLLLHYYTPEAFPCNSDRRSLQGIVRIGTGTAPFRCFGSD
jgi:hypothetical protein